ncbi:hypothetical protein G7Y89_g5789 [Cudoniella acicularis]|uniref:Aminoglycoside phosphotransferase domain-containing protein n=1 Tax=Cudoniella acicularis TaxID=354080 RepID=A0A8H4W660_9HELO|nr:hypothetical protein G7Y89_g5789 [Cudoniella acicularis]
MDQHVIIEHKDTEVIKSAAVSPKAERNQEIMKLLQKELGADPKADLTAHLRRISKPAPPGYPPPRSAKRSKHLPKKMDFYQEVIFSAKNAEIIYPLSDEGALLANYGEAGSTQTDSLVLTLKRMISTSEKLWDFGSRAVLKCSDGIITKITWAVGDCTEYTLIQYLALHAPDVLAPRPHGLTKLGKYRILFITYFPAMTLEHAWPDLTRENKLSIQARLDDIFHRPRSLKLPPGRDLGGVNGEGVQLLLEDHPIQHLNTISAFEDFFFTVDGPYPPSPSWTRFLRSFLPSLEKEPVFTHGDLRTANIMVKPDDAGSFVVTGIIDWECSGFYPDYHESTQVLFLFNSNVENDWYQYVQDCIAPARYPERFLVSRIWGFATGVSAVKRERFRTITS